MIITTIDYSSETFLKLLSALNELVGPKQSLFLYRGNEDSKTVEYTIISDWVIDYDRYLYKRSTEEIRAPLVELKFKVKLEEEKSFSEKIKPLLKWALMKRDERFVSRLFLFRMKNFNKKNNLTITVQNSKIGIIKQEKTV